MGGPGHENRTQRADSPTIYASLIYIGRKSLLVDRRSVRRGLAVVVAIAATTARFRPGRRRRFRDLRPCGAATLPGYAPGVRHRAGQREKTRECVVYEVDFLPFRSRSADDI